MGFLWLTITLGEPLIDHLSLDFGQKNVYSRLSFSFPRF